ncbi:Na+/H+ antiporter NhaC family protein [Oceanospirillum sediminis]|uniref:Sodium:proton antiporter n=1 Tax=Oceanospirillum sediminis TaxID=2760088 RepID=A0A839ITM5_9GAMM|nr:Na+/H+ antiporter NhaC family protein [Oceanospirillum sediminis]MBB1488675.1 sodium:proton antiporter [Oceanospirillum sediminis]
MSSEITQPISIREYDDNRMSDSPVRWILFYGLIMAGFAWLSTLHVEGESYGFHSILPVTLILVVAAISKKALESLFAGIIAGLLLLDPANLFTGLGDISMTVVMDETIAWIVLVCGMMGGLINILERGGSVLSFGDLLATRIKGKRSTMLTTCVLGILVFIDDYLNSLAVSASMKNLTDRYKISREKLAFLVDSTAAPVCILVPVSTWAVYFAALLEENGAAKEGGGMMLYIEAIPYMAYGWLALVIVFLVAAGFLGDLGAMKEAEQRAQNGQPVPDGIKQDGFDTSGIKKVPPIVGLLNFLLPMAVLIGASIYYEVDLLLGALVASLFTIVLYYWQRLLDFTQLVDSMLDGFRVMLHPIAMVCAGFMLKEVNDQLGMTPYIIDSLSPYLSKAMLPALVFATMAAVVFATGSSWAVYVITLPIVLPMALELDISMPLVVGALLSSSAFGSHACFFSDSTVLSAQGSGCTPMQHAVTQIPYVLIGAVLAFISFLVLGFMMA